MSVYSEWKVILLLIVSFYWSITFAFVPHPGVHTKHSVTKESSHKPNYIDLSYSFNNDTIYWPGQKVEFSLHKDKAGYTPEGFWYASYSFCMAEHGGTHLDAPIHFNRNGWTLDQIPPSHLIDVPATVVDVSKHVFAETNESPEQFLLEVEHLIEHESLHGQIPFGGVVLLHTGWGRFWPNKIKYLGYDNTTTGIAPVLRFPGCSEAAARWLSNERSIVGFGIDTPSVDPGESKVKKEENLNL